MSCAYKEVKPISNLKVPRKCSSCGARLLDDALPQYTNDIVPKYFYRYRKGGCGSLSCTSRKVKQSNAIPVEVDIPFTKSRKLLLHKVIDSK